MFFRCECGKIHVVSVIADFCPRCGLDLRYAMFRSGSDRQKMQAASKVLGN